MAVDTHTVDIDEIMPVGELLDGRLLVGQAVIPQVPVPVVMVPLGPVGVTAPVTHGNDDHAELGQRLLTRVRREELRHGLCLGTRIDVRDNRIALGGIEIVRLVHHPIDVGDAVRRLHLVRLRELVAGRGELGKIGDLEIHDLAAAGVEHGGCRHGVDLGVVVHEVPA